MLWKTRRRPPGRPANRPRLEDDLHHDSPNREREACGEVVRERCARFLDSDRRDSLTRPATGLSVDGLRSFSAKADGPVLIDRITTCVSASILEKLSIGEATHDRVDGL